MLGGPGGCLFAKVLASTVVTSLGSKRAARQSRCLI